MQTWLADDFTSIFAGDFGQAITIVHTSSEAIDTRTGTKTKYTTTYSTTGILTAISERDTKLYLSQAKVLDTVIYIKSSDVSVDKGDTVTVSGTSYIVVELQTLQNTSKLFCKKC